MRGAHELWPSVMHAVGISRQRNGGYRPSRVNIVAQGLSTPDPSIRRGRATTTHYTHHQVSLVVSRNTTLVPSLGLRIGPACEAGLRAGMRRERVSPQIRKKKKKRTYRRRRGHWTRVFIGTCVGLLDMTRLHLTRLMRMERGSLYTVPSTDRYHSSGACITY